MNTKVMAYEKAYLTGGDCRWFELEKAIWTSEEGLFKRFLFLEDNVFILVVGDQKDHFVFETVINDELLKSFEEATKKLSMELSC